MRRQEGGEALTQFVRLDGSRTSIVFETAPDLAPLWRYWGPRLPAGVAPPTPLAAARPRPTFHLEVDRPLSVLPAFGLGFFGEPALLAHRGGRDFAHDFRHAETETAEHGVVFHLVDDVAALEVRIAFSLTGDDVLTASSQLVNRGDAALDVRWLAAATLPLPPEIVRVRAFSGRHNNEFVADETLLGAAVFRRENRRGIASHDCFPGALACADGADAQTGRVYAAQLAWSGCHAQTIDRLDDGRRQWQLGQALAPGEILLAPGDAFSTPELLATCSDAGFDGAAQNFHAAIRARLARPRGATAPRPVHLNTWEGVYFDHRLEDLKSLADAAAALGVERFVLDDGWFAGRRDDTTSLGDWTADPERYPEGLAPLADHVVARGMEFGLWIEPEMASPDSRLLAEHPDWTLGIEGRAAILGRNQLVLDLARPEVSEHLFEAIDALLRTLPISYLKWDHNRDLAAVAGSDGRPRYGAQVRAAYALIDRLRARRPDVEIESCAGGGGRVDAGVLSRTTRVWASDCLDARVRLSLQREMLHFFPPEIIGAHVGAAPAHATGRSHSTAFRALVALPGHFGVELDPRRLSDADREALGFWIRQYKSLRPLLHRGPVWRGATADGVVWQAHGDGTEGALFVYRVEHPLLRYAPPLKLPFVARDRRYRLREIAHGEQGFLPSAGAAFFQSLRGDGAVVEGAWLAADGLPCPPMAVETAALITYAAL